MSTHRMDCVNDCPRYTEGNKCCHSSTMPIPCLALSQAVEVAQKHEYDRTNWNYRRFVLPSYLTKRGKV